jgi:dTDP-4-dehydrorhamnose 3,5-epimerase
MKAQESPWRIIRILTSMHVGRADAWKKSMQKREMSLPGVWLIEPRVFQDERGFFLETYQSEKFAALGITHPFIQDNLAGSARGVLRGLHYQVRHPQGKLIQAIHGEVFDVVVDLRRSSPNFGKWVGVSLKSVDHSMLWVPPGFAHGYYVVSEQAEVAYKVTDRYAPEWERTLLWNDPALGIEWPLIDNIEPILSVKDAAGKRLSDADTFE